jgi:WD40 repeat protein
VRIWDVPTGKCLATCAGHEAYVTHVAISSDGRLVASAAEDSTVRLWDSATGKALATLTDGQPPLRVYFNSVVFSPDGAKVIAVGPTVSGSVAILWDVASRAVVHRMPLAGETGTALAISPDGKLLAVASDTVDQANRRGQEYSGARIRFMAMDTKALVREIRVGSIKRVRDMDFSPDGNSLASACPGDKESAAIWKVATGTCQTTFHPANYGIGGAWAVRFSPGGRSIVCGCAGLIRIVAAPAPAPAQLVALVVPVPPPMH